MKENKFSLFKLVSKKPIIPNQKEVNKNISSRSAKLRFAIRNNNSFFYPSEFKEKFESIIKLVSQEIGGQS